MPSDEDHPNCKSQQFDDINDIHSRTERDIAVRKSHSSVIMFMTCSSALRLSPSHRHHHDYDHDHDHEYITTLQSQCGNRLNPVLLGPSTTLLYLLIGLQHFICSPEMVKYEDDITCRTLT